MNYWGLILIALVGGVIYFGARLFGNDSSKRARMHAESHGIEVTKASRQVPITNGTWHRIKYELKEEECACYSIPHQCKSPQQWKLLQRFDPEHKDTDYWKYESISVPSAELQAAIDSFKEDFDEDYYEIEVQSVSVNVYWNEWGGVEVVNTLLEHMKRFSLIDS